MSRSYHVTEKEATAAFYEGDLEPGYQASEKSWVKQEQKKARQQGVATPNRSIVSDEIGRTDRIKRKRGEE